jgi:hypothetical protein
MLAILSFIFCIFVFKEKIMAGIDKTYTDNYKDYKSFKEWANKKIITFFDGHRECIGDWVWDYDKKDFDNGEIPIMNTPTWIDIYLIQNCKSSFVLERMKNVYGECDYNNYKNVDLTAKPPKNFKQNRKISILNNHKTKFPLHSKPYNGTKWWLQCDDNYWYNDETKTWIHYDSYYPYNTNTAHIGSIKAIVNHLRKQYLPKGVKFTINGKYIGEEYSVIIK